MKKIILLIITLLLAVSLVACSAETVDLSMTAEQYSNVKLKSEGVMTYAEYAAAEIDDEVVIEAYVQATQSWWDNKITVYAADLDGAYFLYEMACSEADAAKLTPGTKIKVTGYKGAWAGEVEVMNATFEFVGEKGDTYTAPTLNVTALAGKDSIIKYQNQFVLFKGMTVAAYDESGAAISYKGGERGDDIYFNATVNGVTVEFCIERYLTDPDSQVYKDVEALKVGDKIDIECYLYWYDGANPHVTGITTSK